MCKALRWEKGEGIGGLLMVRRLSGVDLSLGLCQVQLLQTGFFFFLYLHHISLTQSQWQQQLFVHNTPALCAGSRLVSNRGSSKEKKPLRVAIFQSQTHNFVFVLIKSNSMNSGPGAQTMSGLVSDGGTVDL